MKYATWKLNFDNPKYGTGPEQWIAEQGFWCEGGHLIGEPDGGTIVGYFTGEPVDLDSWEFAEVAQEQALALVLEIDATAHIVEDGKIGILVTDEID